MTTRLHRLQPIILGFILWFTVGCSAVTLRQAQDHFNTGTEIELRGMDRSLLSDNPYAAPGDSLAALNEYRLANSVTTKLINEKSKELKQDELLGATYVLRAMALWRISDLEGDTLADSESPSATQPAAGVANSRQELLAVLATITNLEKEQLLTLGTRDRVLHKALYGFYDHDGGRAADGYPEAREWFQSAEKRLQDAVAGEVPQRHPVRVYVGSAQLRTLAAWNLALYIERKNCNLNPNLPSCNLLDDDQSTINAETRNVICLLRPFWDGKTEVKDNLTKLLFAIGLPSVFRECQ